MLAKYLADFHTDGTYLYSKVDGKSYKVGATFSTYEVAGNFVSFRPDRALTREYKMPFAMCIDFTGGKTSNTAPINLYTLKGRDLVINELVGAGIKDGEISTLVSGGALTAQGYASIAVTNPYKSFLLYSTETAY